MLPVSKQKLHPDVQSAEQCPKQHYDSKRLLLALRAKNTVRPSPLYAARVGSELPAAPVQSAPPCIQGSDVEEIFAVPKAKGFVPTTTNPDPERSCKFKHALLTPPTTPQKVRKRRTTEQYDVDKKKMVQKKMTLNKRNHGIGATPLRKHRQAELNVPTTKKVTTEVIDLTNGNYMVKKKKIGELTGTSKIIDLTKDGSLSARNEGEDKCPPTGPTTEENDDARHTTCFLTPQAQAGSAWPFDTGALPEYEVFFSNKANSTREAHAPNSKAPRTADDSPPSQGLKTTKPNPTNPSTHPSIPPYHPSPPATNSPQPNPQPTTHAPNQKNLVPLPLPLPHPISSPSPTITLSRNPSPLPLPLPLPPRTPQSPYLTHLTHRTSRLQSHISTLRALLPTLDPHTKRKFAKVIYLATALANDYLIEEMGFRDLVEGGGSKGEEEEQGLKRRVERLDRECEFGMRGVMQGE